MFADELVTTLPGRVLVVIPDRSMRALVRAELIERGYDAVGVVTVADALTCPIHEPGRGPVWLVLLDQPAVAQVAPSSAEELTARFPEAELVLLASRLSERPPGPWTEIIERPVSIGEIAGLVDRARKRVGQHPAGSFELRLGAPWPAAFCRRCGSSRHCEPPRDEAELYRAQVDLDDFVRRHSQAHGNP